MQFICHGKIMVLVYFVNKNMKNQVKLTTILSVLESYIAVSFSKLIHTIQQNVLFILSHHLINLKQNMHVLYMK